jgi:hypothetical protein
VSLRIDHAAGEDPSQCLGKMSLQRDVSPERRLLAPSDRIAVCPLTIQCTIQYMQLYVDSREGALR